MPDSGDEFDFGCYCDERVNCETCNNRTVFQRISLTFKLMYYMIFGPLFHPAKYKCLCLILKRVREAYARQEAEL